MILDPNKAYIALYWERCMEILVAYRVGPQKEHLLRKYWEGFTMASRSGRYYGAPF